MNASEARRTIVGLVVGSVLLTACGANGTAQTSSPRASEPDSSASEAPTVSASTVPDSLEPAAAIPVSFRADVYYTGKLLPVIAGIQTGIYEAHGLDVTMNPGTGSGTTVQTVANGSDNIGYADAGVLTQFAAQGLAVKVVAGDVQISPLGILYWPDVGIESPKDLEGRTGGFTPGSSAESLWPAFVAATGIDPSTITFFNVDIPTRGSIFLARKTDFTFGLEDVSLPNSEEKCECDLKMFLYSDYGIHSLSSSFITSDSFLESNPEAVRRFLAATAEAKAWTEDNIEAALDAFFEFDPDSRVSRAVLQIQYELARDKAHTENSEGWPWGCMAPLDWETTIDTMEQYGGVQADSVTPADLATNDYLADECPVALK